MWMRHTAVNKTKPICHGGHILARKTGEKRPLNTIVIRSAMKKAGRVVWERELF